MCQFSTKERKTGQEIELMSNDRCQPNLCGAEFPFETGVEKTENEPLHASLFVQLPTSAVPDYRRYGRKVTFEPNQISSPQNQPLSRGAK